MWYWSDGMGWGLGLVMVVFMVLFWGTIIALVVWGIKKLTERGGSETGARGKSPLDIARERYARGEITKEEFDRIKQDLS
ncbi:MAG: SHOCT domain-containing protein [Dehalococcoidales bacterium]|nr:SHOCT domain-containing protein [Dehalococcoidales bacterium]